MHGVQQAYYTVCSARTQHVAITARQGNQAWLKGTSLDHCMMQYMCMTLLPVKKTAGWTTFHARAMQFEASPGMMLGWAPKQEAIDKFRERQANKQKANQIQESSVWSHESLLVDNAADKNKP